MHACLRVCAVLPSSAVGTVEFRSLLEPIRVSNPFVTYIEAACEARTRSSCPPRHRIMLPASTALLYCGHVAFHAAQATCSMPIA